MPPAFNDAFKVHGVLGGCLELLIFGGVFEFEPSASRGVAITSGRVLSGYGTELSNLPLSERYWSRQREDVLQMYWWPVSRSAGHRLGRRGSTASNTSPCTLWRENAQRFAVSAPSVSRKTEMSVPWWLVNRPDIQARSSADR